MMKNILSYGNKTISQKSAWEEQIKDQNQMRKPHLRLKKTEIKIKRKNIQNEKQNTSEKSTKNEMFEILKKKFTF